MDALNLNPKTLAIKQLNASEFPEPADVYVCDKCDRDITSHLHRGHAHIRQPLGPSRYVCACGQSYPSGSAEWDDLSDWEKRRWLADVRLAVIVLVLLAVLSVLVHSEIVTRSTALVALSVVAFVFLISLFPLFIAILAVPLQIAASLWRTRIVGASRRK